MTAARAESLSRVEGRRRQLRATAGVAAIAPHVFSEFNHKFPLNQKSRLKRPGENHSIKRNRKGMGDQ